MEYFRKENLYNLCTCIWFGEDECVLFLRGVKDTAGMPQREFESIVEDGPWKTQQDISWLSMAKEALLWTSHICFFV